MNVFIKVHDTLLGVRVEQLRLKKGLSQEQLGKTIGFPERGIQIMETEYFSEVSAHVMMELAKALNVSIDELTGKNDNNLTTKTGG